MTRTPHLALPYLQPQQAQKHVTVNDVMQTLDALVQISVLSQNVTTPPQAPNDGDRYLGLGILGGEWIGMDNRLLVYIDGEWRAYSPQAGWIIWIQDEAILRIFDGTVWTETITGIQMLGVNADADALNRFTLKSDASLIDHDGTDHRMKINKAGEMNIGSLSFQSNYSTCAEIGLIETHDLTVNVSADGVTFLQALSFQRDTGFMGAGTASPASRLHVKQATDARITIDTESIGSGGGFDIINSGTGQSWRVTGQTELLKFRDHTAGLDKLVIKNGADGDVLIDNCGNVGIGTSIPSARLDVDGAVRIGQFSVASLPSANTSGSGAIAYITNASGGATMAYSDGANWRRIKDDAVAS